MNCLKFKLFGDLSVSFENERHEEKISSSVNSVKMWSMLTYLVINRERKIPFDELTEILWTNKDLLNPANSLKALLFKIRTLFSSLGIENPKEVIKCSNGCFAFSKYIQISTDIDDFRILYNKIMSENNSVSSLDIQKIKSIYRGNLLIQLQLQAWAVTASNIYHTQFVNLCSHVLEILMKLERYNEAIILAAYSTSIEPYDEFMQKCLLLSYIKTNHSYSALKHYKYIKKLYLQYLGEVPSRTITDLYNVIVNSITPESTDISDIREELEENETESAFFCEFSTFKEIYRVSVRNLKRRKLTTALGAVVIKNYPKLSAAKRSSETALLQNFIGSNLRIGDVFTRPAGDKFLILLNETNQSNADIILKRIVKGYRREIRNSKLELIFTSITDRKTADEAVKKQAFTE